MNKRVIYELLLIFISILISWFIESSTYKYNFIDKKIAKYIEFLCTEVNVDSDLVFGILINENEKFDVNAMNKNKNGTIDCGLFQLNDKYLWTTFKDNYWKEEIELDPFNWKHNTYIAIHHIKYLQNNLKSQNEVIMAYNCGITAVRKGRIPKKTKLYLMRVNYNIDSLKNGGKNKCVVLK